jgi:general transcription factor 3C protein 4
MPCDEDRFSWSGLKTLSLDACDITFDSSIFHPISGIERVSGSDTLILSVFDGSIHVLDNISTLPEFMQSESENGMSTETLSTHARTANVKAETREQKTSIAITRHDANRVGGMTIYDKGATVAWLHE